MSYEKIEKYYPDSYLEHFLAMFSEELSRENLENHINLASSIEGKEYVEVLKNEVKLIIENSHEIFFISEMIEKGYHDFDAKWISIILKSANKHLQDENL